MTKNRHSRGRSDSFALEEHFLTRPVWTGTGGQASHPMPLRDTGIASARRAEESRRAFVVLREELLRLVKPTRYDGIEYGAMFVEFAALLVGAARGELAIAVGLVVELLTEAQQQPRTTALKQSEMESAMQALPLGILFVAVLAQ